MTSPTQPEEIEVRSKTLTPVSPRPIYLPEPSNITVLENQMDPIFNDTSTHLPPSQLDAGVESPGQHAGAAPETAFSTAYTQPAAFLNDGADQTLLSQEVTDNYAGALNVNNIAEIGDGDTVKFTTNGLPPNTTLSHSQPEATAGADESPNVITSAVLPSPSHPSSTLPDIITPSHAVNEAADALSSTIAGAARAQEERTGLLTSTDPDAANGTAVANGGVDFQALLDNLSPSAPNAPLLEGTLGASSVSSANSATHTQSESIKAPNAGLTAHATLPPRPPPQEKPSTHPGYSPQDDIRSYHPHKHTPAQTPSYSNKQPTTFRPGPTLPAPLIAAGAPGTSSQPIPGLPPPPVATFQQQPPPSALTQKPGQRDKLEGKNPASITSADEDEDPVPWNEEIQKIYDQFLVDERNYVSDGQWDKFPPNSRMFIGNLPTEKVTKRDLFSQFHKFGRLAQISIKQAFGFIQFLDAASCAQALRAMQGQTVRGRKMHLEVSKPQKNTRNAAADAGNARSGNRRSRSPDYNRGDFSPRGGGGRFGPDRVDRGVDNRNSGGGPLSRDRDRDRDFGGRPRVRDDYRPGRSPSPRAPRGRDDHRAGRERDRYFDRYDRERSRSPPYGRGGRYRSRSPPSRHAGHEEEPPVRRRPSVEVPEVQIIVLDDLNPRFVEYVEKSFRDRNIRTDVMVPDPRQPLSAIVRMQIIEGVKAVARLTRQSQLSVKIPLQVFDRRAGADNVRFDEYENLDLNIAAELVLQARQTHGAPVHAQYNAPNQAYQQPAQFGQPYAAPTPQVPASAPAGPPNLANLITSLDGPTLQKLLGALSQPGQAHGQAQAPLQPQVPPQAQQLPGGLPANLASLLGGTSVPQQAPPLPQQPQSNMFSTLASNPAFAGNPQLASLLANAGARPQQPHPQHPHPPSHPQHQGQPHPPQQPQHNQTQPAQQVQNIMEQLAKWKQ